MPSRAKPKASTDAGAAKDAAYLASDTIESMAAVGRETLKTMMNMGAGAATENYRNVASVSKEQMDVTKNAYEKMMSYGKENIEAVSASSTAAASGIEAYYEQLMEFTKVATAENIDTMQRIFAAKTPQELMDLQMDAVNKSINRAISQATKLNKIATVAATRSFEPVKARVEGTMDSFVKPFLAA